MRARKLQETAPERARARAERRFQKRQQYRRQHGFFFFRRWGLHMISFARSLKRLGESALGFEQLWQGCERLLRIEPRTSHEKETRDERQETSQAEGSSLVSRLPSLGPLRVSIRDLQPGGHHFLRSVARYLAQTIWLGRRVRRALDDETSIRLEARLRTMAELQAILRGDHGAEAQARLQEHLGRVMGPELEEYKLLKMFGSDPELVWPRRLSRHLMEMILEVVDDRRDRREQVRRLRRRMRRVLGQGSGAVRDSGPGARGSGTRDSVFGVRGSHDETLDSGPGTEPAVGSPQSVAANHGPQAPNSACPQGLKIAPQAPNLEEEISAQTPNFELTNSELSNRQSPESRCASPESPTTPNPEDRTPNPEEKYWARYDRLSPALQLGWLTRENWQAEHHGLTVEELRDHLILKPAEALSRFFWKAGRGWFGESQHRTRGTQGYRVPESYAAGPREWWPEARELEIRAEVEWRRHSCLRDSGSTARNGCATAYTHLAYSELKTLLAAAFDFQGRDERQETRDELAVSRPAVISGPLPDGRDEKRETSTPDRRGETRSSVRGFPNPQSRAPSPDDLLVSRLSPLVSGNPSLDSRLSPLVSDNPSLVSRPLERVARLLWVIVHTGESDVRREERRLEVETRNSKFENRTSNECGPSSILNGESPELRVASPQTPNSELRNSELTDPEPRVPEPSAPSPESRLDPARHSSLVTRHLLNALHAHDRESDFRRTERQLRLSEALRRFGQALYPEPIQARDEDGYLYRLTDEFDHLRLNSLWFDAERKAILRQDLGLDPLPADFETPELPDELLNPRSRMRRELLRSMTQASWRWYEDMERQQGHLGILFTPEDAAGIESGRLTVEDWWARYAENS